MTDMGAVGWTFAVLGLWIIAFPAYLATRPRYVAMARPTDTVKPPAPPSLVPAGWLADPTERFELRYWNGVEWTAHVSRAGMSFEDSL